MPRIIVSLFICLWMTLNCCKAEEDFFNNMIEKMYKATGLEDLERETSKNKSNPWSENTDLVKDWFLDFFTVKKDYHWLPGQNIYDCIAAIVYKNKTIGTGVFLSPSSLLTTANVAEPFMNNPSQLLVYSKYRNENRSRSHTVKCIAPTIGRGTYRTDNYYQKYWVRQGFTYDHSPIHDLLILGLKNNWFGDSNFLNDLTLALPEEVWKKLREDKWINDRRWVGTKIFGMHYNYNGFHATMNEGFYEVNETDYKRIRSTTIGWYYAGFSCCDKYKINENDGYLVTGTANQVDCDEWIPRQWGYFICITINDKYRHRALGSGTALFHGNSDKVLGLASFSVTKNNETMHAFTELKIYYDYLYTCTPLYFHVNLKYYLVYYKLKVEMWKTWVDTIAAWPPWQ